MEQLGRYKIIRQIGEGGLGSVYLGEDPAIGRQVAIKVIPLGAGGDVDYQVKRISREVAILGQLDHPNIIKIFDVGQQHNDAYIVMEYVEGGDLGQLIEARHITPNLAATILEDSAKALDYAHGRGVVHRDIKPSNILVSKEQRVFLTDFGIARIQKSDRTTVEFTVVGTINYMSPEQVEGKEPVGASDQFSLAVVVYQLLTGALPFGGETVGSTLHTILTSTPKLPHTQNQTISPNASPILLKALEKDPNKRYSSCAEFISELLRATDRLAQWIPRSQEGRSEEFLQGAPDSAAQSVPPPRPISSQRPHEATAITRLEHLDVPTDFVLPNKSKFFRADRVRFEKIEESIRFYRDNLNADYQRLANQADLAYKLWLGCVAVGFLTLATGIVMMFVAGLAKGAVTAASTVLVYFIQKVFQQREDHYRKAADEKSSHLEYGNQWLLVIQSVDAIESSEERVKRQARLVDVLTQKLERRQREPQKERPRSARKKASGELGPRLIQ
jgi:serine/threonine protein kinase